MVPGDDAQNASPFRPETLSISPPTDDVGTSQISEPLKSLSITPDNVDTSEPSDQVKDPANSQVTCWTTIPPDIQDLILAFLPIVFLFQVRTVCKNFRDVIKRVTFHQARARLYPSEGSLSPLVFHVKNGLWHVTGFDSKVRFWRDLPPFIDVIPAPDPDLFKDFLVTGHSGLFCVDVGRASEPEKLYVYNPLTRETLVLPALKFRRHPVVLNVHVTPTKKGQVVSSSYRVIAVGSAAIGTESLSRKTEVYNSVTRKWDTAGEVPGTDFSLNEYQTGVYCESQNLLLCVGFIFNGSKGLLAFDAVNGEWRDNWDCTLPQDTDTGLMVFFAIAQLIKCNGVVYLFSEQEAERNVTHCIDRLDFSPEGKPSWKRKLTRPRQSNRALLVYPEFTCVPMPESKLCIFNTVERTGVVYDLSEDPFNHDVQINADIYEPLLGPPGIEKEAMFHSLNPVGYAFEPNFWVSVGMKPEE